MKIKRVFSGYARCADPKCGREFKVERATESELHCPACDMELELIQNDVADTGDEELDVEDQREQDDDDEELDDED